MCEQERIQSVQSDPAHRNEIFNADSCNVFSHVTSSLVQKENRVSTKVNQLNLTRYVQTVYLEKKIKEIKGRFLS